MTAKEKAIELMQKFRSLDLSELSKNNDGIIVGITSKQCALIAVDLRLEGYFTFTSIEYGEDSLEFWQQVKNEIELL